MPFNQENAVTSSQDEIAEGARSAISMSDIKPGKIWVKPPVAKVLPNAHKEEAKVFGGVDEIKEKVKVMKKQVSPWLCKFNALCREAVGTHCYQRLDNLMNIYVRYVAEDVKNCFRKPHRAWKLKTRMNEYMNLFHMLYKDVRKPLEYNHYHERMSDILAMYLDMEIRASRRAKEDPRTIAGRVTSNLFVLLEDSMDHILNAIIKAKFFNKTFREICIHIIQRVLRDIPKELTENQYVQYCMVFKKMEMLVVGRKERTKVNKRAMEELKPPPEMYPDSDRYLTLTLMNTFSVKDDSEDYKHTSLSCESLVSSLDDLKLGGPLLTDELIGLYDNDDPQSERCMMNYMKKMWSQLVELDSDSVGQYAMADLLEAEFTAKIKNRQAVEEKLRLGKAARKTRKAKKGSKATEKKPAPTQSGMSSSHNCYGRPISSASSSIIKVKNETSLYKNVEDQKSVSRKMEADSQSQTEIVTILLDSDDDEHTEIKVEPEVKDEEHESTKWEASQPPRAWVRPEQKQLTPNKNLMEVTEDTPEDIQVLINEFCIKEQEKKTEEDKKAQGNGEIQGRETLADMVNETVFVEDTTTCFTEPEHASPLEESKTTLLNDIATLSQEEGGIFMDGEGSFQNQQFEDLFDPYNPNNRFMLGPDSAGHTYDNWSCTHDVILSQYEDDLWMQYKKTEESGNLVEFAADFYNEQPVLTGPDNSLFSLLEEDDSGEDELTTHWDSSIISESYSPRLRAEKSFERDPGGPEREEEEEKDPPREDASIISCSSLGAECSSERNPESPEGEDEEPLQTSHGPKRPKPTRHPRNKSISKKSIPPSKEVEQVEKKSKEKAVGDVSKTSKKEPRGKKRKVHFEDEIEEEEAEPELEPEPSKKQRGRKAKTAKPAPRVQPLLPVSQTNGRKAKDTKASSSTAAKKKTPPGRKRRCNGARTVKY